MSSTPSIELIRRDARSLNIHLFTTDDDDVSTDIDITGKTIYFTVKRNLNDSDDEAVIGPKSVSVHTTPLEGRTVISLTSDDTDIDEGAYYYDFSILTGSIPQSTKRGTLNIVQDVYSGGA